ncbi:PilZ domain-containing protein [Rhizobium sp.]
MMKAQQGFVLNEDQQYFQRRQVRLEATLSCMKSGLRGYISQPCIVLNISEGGCMVSCSVANEFGNDVHIQIAGVPAKIACTVVGRTVVRLNLVFTEILPSVVIDRLAARHAEASL